MSDETKKDGLQRQQIAPRAFSLMPSSLGEAMEIAKLIAESDFAPKDYKGKPGNVMIAIQMGADVGLKPMQSLQNIAVINGRPSIWGDAALALLQASGIVEKFHEYFKGEKGTDSWTAVCEMKRVGWPDLIVRTFSVADAKKAKLWGKTGRDGQPTPWVTYEDRMLQMRARGFTVRDGGADKLMGLVLAEEAMDFPDAIEGTVVSSQAVTDPLERIPEGLRDNIGRAFDTLSLSGGQRIQKINEFLGAGVDPEQGAQALLDWCKDEFSKRKTGQPRKKGDDNGRKAPAPKETVKESAPVVTGAVIDTQAERSKEPDVSKSTPVETAKAEAPASSFEF